MTLGWKVFDWEEEGKKRSDRRGATGAEPRPEACCCGARRPSGPDDGLLPVCLSSGELVFIGAAGGRWS